MYVHMGVLQNVRPLWHPQLKEGIGVGLLGAGGKLWEVGGKMKFALLHR